MSSYSSVYFVSYLTHIPISKLTMTHILDIISETYDFKYIILKGTVTPRNHSNCSHCFRFKWNACIRREYHVNDFCIGLWNEGMENNRHMKGLTSLGTSAKRLSNFWLYTLNQKGPAGFKISALLAWITLLLLRTWITLTADPFVKKKWSLLLSWALPIVLWLWGILDEMTSLKVS